MIDLERIYRETLQRCRPEALVRAVAGADMPRHVVAIGKAAGPLLDGFASVVSLESALAAIPRGYPPPRVAAEAGGAPQVRVVYGGHPEIDEDSFRAGEELLRYADQHHEVTFLISGGGSACAEVPLRPFFTEAEVADLNHRLISAGLPIAQINSVRKHVSAMKGGRLAARVQTRSVTLIYSDVAPGDLASVASGPTVPDATTLDDAARVLARMGGCDRIVTALQEDSVPETVKEISNARAVLIADNETLVTAAAKLVEEGGWRPRRITRPVESDVTDAARFMAGEVASLQPGEVLVAGGEPTVIVRGTGRGGRCLELAIRFVIEQWKRGSGDDLHALFASSDGVDGNSGVAGIAVELPAAVDASRAEAALGASDSLSLAAEIGRPIIIAPTGNNLRDLYLVARR